MYVLFSHLTGQKGGLPPTTHLVLPLYRLLALLEQVHLSFLRGQVTVLLTVYWLECPQKVHTTQTLTLRIIQLKLIRKNVVQQRVKTFGIVDILQKGLEAQARLLKGVILVQIHCFPQGASLKRSRTKPCDCRTGTASPRAEARVPCPMRRSGGRLNVVITLFPRRERL